MSQEKRRFSIGSARNATCAISKQWGVSIWPTTRWLSLSWRQSSARSFTRCHANHRNEGNIHEDICTRNHSPVCARCAFFRREFVHEKGRLRKTERRRLLHLHDAPVGAFNGSWKMSYLLDGSRAGDEKKRQ